MGLPLEERQKLQVALLAEGVDRNDFDPIIEEIDAASPSSRRAWIEISSVASMCGVDDVALLAEGVDRNMPTAYRQTMISGRPPRGGRG